MSMLGSGIYSWDEEFEDKCPNCGTVSTHTLYVDDYGSRSVTCHECGDVRRPGDSGPDDYEPEEEPEDDGIGPFEDDGQDAARERAERRRAAWAAWED